MISRSLCIAFVSLALLSCGVKSELELPSGAMPDKREQDPSRPPKPLGESGGTTLPYPTGP
jgi:predicted small lipoprotein YifL